MAYAASSDMTARYDVRRLGDLVTDDDTRATSGQLVTNPAMVAALDDASGMIDAAAQRGQRYTPTDLANLLAATQGSALYNSYKLLVRLTCDLAYGLLVARRGYNSTDAQAMAPRYVEALRMLERLENGEWIFTTQGALAAGVPVPEVVLSQNVALLSSNYRIFGNLGVYPGSFYPMYTSFGRW